MAGPLLLAIDQGTSSTKALVVDASGAVVARAQASVSLATPEPGWVEQDAEDVWGSVRRAVSEALDAQTAKRVVSVGLSTQRESCVIWDRRSGEALTPVLSWQDQRTEPICASLRKNGHEATVRRKSGLPLDPMFSAAKARWLLDKLPHGQARAKAGEVCIGTIDAFLLSRFGGEAIVEAGNASRTQLFDVVQAAWDEELLAIFDIPLAALPRIVASIGPFPRARGLAPLPDGVPVGAVLADSHSALFAHGVFAPGPVKATQGTGSSLMGLVERGSVRDGNASERIADGLREFDLLFGGSAETGAAGNRVVERVENGGVPQVAIALAVNTESIANSWETLTPVFSSNLGASTNDARSPSPQVAPVEASVKFSSARARCDKPNSPSAIEAALHPRAA